MFRLGETEVLSKSSRPALHSISNVRRSLKMKEDTSQNSERMAEIAGRLNSSSVWPHGDSSPVSPEYGGLLPRYLKLHSGRLSMPFF